jgi:hypothetical protein
MQTTQHTHQVVFGRKVDGCPRCTELRLGMPARRWGNYSTQAKSTVARMDRGHVCTSRCGAICTYGDW